jgi:serine/threonine-protein kinase RsbW
MSGGSSESNLAKPPPSPTTPPGPAHQRWSVPSDTSELATVRRDVEAFCTAVGFDQKSADEVGLVINEAMANILRHAYAGKHDGRMDIDADFADDILTLTIRDWGSGVLPPLQPRKKDPLEPGGLGMVCLRSLMDDIRFDPQPDGMLLTMTRQRNRKTS